MTVQMTSRRMNGLALVDVRGSLATGSAGAVRGRLAAAVAHLADTGVSTIAVNLAEVIRVDASGLGELVLALRAAHDRGARLTLVAPPPRVRRMLAITCLDKVFEIKSSFGGSDRSERSGPRFPILRSSPIQWSTPRTWLVGGPGRSG
jgi:anti-anti-sigma factor